MQYTWNFLAILSLLTATVAFAQNTPPVIIRSTPDSHGVFRLGIMSYSKTDGNQKIAGSASVLNYEYTRGTKLDQALVMGIKQATDSVSQRDTQLTAYAGWRIFPMGIGIPVTYAGDSITMTYDGKYKPYAEAAIGMGRALLLQDESGNDYSSDTLSILFGGGVASHFFSRWWVDFQVMYEIVQGRGGTADSIAISGTNLYMLLGNGVLF